MHIIHKFSFRHGPRIEKETKCLLLPTEMAPLYYPSHFIALIYKRLRSPVPEFIDPVFTKTSPKRLFSLNRKRAFWLVFANTGSIISGTGIDSEESIPPAYVAWWANMSHRVVVPARQAGNRFLGPLKGLQIRAPLTQR
jgi:hypothetical protein